MDSLLLESPRLIHFNVVFNEITTQFHSTKQILSLSLSSSPPHTFQTFYSKCRNILFATEPVPPATDTESDSLRERSMKFWKSLSNLIEETLPDWRDKFLSYKDLKKQLKLIYPKEGERANKRPRLDDLDRTVDDDCTDGGGDQRDEVTKEVNDFVRLLEDEIEKFNSFFVENEEMYVITLKELQDAVAKAKDSNEELMKVGREIVDLHGEMVLLENYSALNYTGLVKILKKYDKRSGALIRLPFIQKVLQEPFYSTDVLNKLVKECETMLDHLFSINEPSTSSEAANVKEGYETETGNDDGKRPLEVPKELSEIESMESMYVKHTLSALRVLKEIRSGSSTVSVFSLPPLQTHVEEDWKKISVIEQAAK